jgi:diguanylate cyclase
MNKKIVATARGLHDTLASSVWRRQILPCLLVGMLGVGVTLIAANRVAERDDQQAAEQFRVTAENDFMTLQNGLNEYLSKLFAARALFDSSSSPVTREQFETFARPLLRDVAIQNLSWVPRVLDSERAENERAGVLQGIAGYHLKAMGPDGKLVPAPKEAEYYPVFYATIPLTSPLFGLDLRSEPETLAELDRARDEDRLGFSTRQALVSTGGTQPGFLFELPVYGRGLPHDTVEERRRNLIGFVHGSFITSKMIDTIIYTTTTPRGLDLFFFKPDAAGHDLPIFAHGSRLRTTPLAPIQRAAAAAGLEYSRDLMADGQPWLTVVTRPMPDGPLTVQHHRTRIVLIFGLILTGALVSYLWATGLHSLRMLRLNKIVSDLAQRDPLTLLANRRAFVQDLSETFAAFQRGGKPFAVLYFDLDHFKDVNDTLGHSIGDALLRLAAQRVKAAVRATDVVARFGGDEFAILQRDVEDLAAAGTLARKIGALLAEPYLIKGNQVHVTASIGIARYTPEVASPDAMMIQADLALYRAKQEGRNCFRFHSADLDREVQERVTISEELRGAAERGELVLFYQPQVELRTGRIVGLEALLRWNHPKYGQLSPAMFIPVAERTGQIQTLERWVLDAACRQLRAWQDEGIAPGLLGVNVSALHFKGSADLDREIADGLNRWKIAPGAVEIELTETVLMEITQQHNDRFERLRQLGVRIAIDDFGTGYSSLSYLANYPISRVKIAQELVFGVVAESRSAAIVRAAVRLAHELAIDVIAEGVETEDQAKFLLSVGCEQGQGFYFSRPVDAPRATELLRAGMIKPARLLRLVESTAA